MIDPQAKWESALRALEETTFRPVDAGQFEQELEIYLHQSEDYYFPREIDQREFSRRWYRSAAMRCQSDVFINLLGACHRCWLLLDQMGMQTALGERAGLQPLRFNIGSKDQVRFDTADLPANGSLFFPQYVSENFKRSSQFGARLFWWCAAAYEPEFFEYGWDIRFELGSQPFWFVDDEEGQCRPNPEPLQLLIDAVRLVAKSVASDETSDDVDQGVVLRSSSLDVLVDAAAELNLPGSFGGLSNSGLLNQVWLLDGHLDGMKESAEVQMVEVRPCQPAADDTQSSSDESIASDSAPDITSDGETALLPPRGVNFIEGSFCIGTRQYLGFHHDELRVLNAGWQWGEVAWKVNADDLFEQMYRDSTRNVPQKKSLAGKVRRISDKFTQHGGEPVVISYTQDDGEGRGCISFQRLDCPTGEAN